MSPKCKRPLCLVLTGLCGVFLFLCVSVSAAFAIPSPELIAGSITSISQLFAIASAFLGGGAALLTIRARRSNVIRAARTLLGITIGASFLLSASIAFNIYQYINQKNERQARLEDTILRPARTPGSLPLDPENREWSYAAQAKSRFNISTVHVHDLLRQAQRGERKDVLFIDVREAAERQVGTIPGIPFVRYPDFAKAQFDFTGKQVILLCHNGDRSNETCELLRKQGIDCRFMLGGLEKWIVEGRPIEGFRKRTLKDLQALPRYSNDKTLLDTPEVRRLVATEKAVFVDVRYPSEFKNHGHLPGAINLTIRRMSTEELGREIAALPQRPIILPCYDRRGCFFSQVLGYELSQAGHDFRGRFPLPWTYFVQPPRPPHVEEWLGRNNQSIWMQAGQQLAVALVAMSNWTGIAIAILLLALVSRLFVLPFALKAERDQMQTRAAASRIDAIKQRFKDDGVRRGRALHAFYRSLGITPVRNLIALLFLPILAVAVLAIDELVASNPARFLWIRNLGERDSWFILPSLFAALIALYADLSFVNRPLHRLLVWFVAFPLLTLTAALFSAGANLYLVASAALLLLQRQVVSGGLKPMWRRWRQLRLGADIISLDEPELLSIYGAKASRLAQMRSVGLPVPAGVLLTPRFLKEFLSKPSEARQHHLNRIWNWLGSVPLAVRSCAAAEDGKYQSYAGVFESILNVDRIGLEDAVKRVLASFEAERVIIYGASQSENAILVQRMVSAEYAGVLFTRDPAAGGLAMIEMVRGTAQNLVSGAERPEMFRVGRISNEIIGKTHPPMDITSLHNMGRRAEVLFGRPQDIEWTFDGSGFQLVQSRDITQTVNEDGTTALLRRDISKALDLTDADADSVAFAKTEFSELLPRPTPLSLSLMEELWESGGSVDLAARALNLSYRITEPTPSHFVTILGRLYVIQKESRSRTVNIGPVAARRLRRDADRIEGEFRNSFLPQFLREVRLLEQVDFDNLGTKELFDALQTLRDKFVHQTHVEVDVINLVTSYYVETARKQLVAHGRDPSSHLGHIPETYEARALSEMHEVQPEERIAYLLSMMGHRSVIDYELAEPRYNETLSALVPMSECKPLSSQAGIVGEKPASRALKKSIEIARRFQALKEDAKHHSLRELAVIRKAVLALDRRLSMQGLAFFLTFDELMSLRDTAKTQLSIQARARQRDRDLLLTMQQLPARLTARELERLSAGGDLPHHDSESLIVRGTRVAGSGVVAGKARVIQESDAERSEVIKDFQDGDIIVTSMVNPAWLPYFSRAGGFVCEVGAWLSHTAILAREYDVAMIVNTHGISSIRDGSWIRLHPEGIIDILSDNEAPSGAPTPVR